MNFILKYLLGKTNEDEIDQEIILYKPNNTKNNIYLYNNIKDCINTEELYSMFKNALQENPDLALKILLHTRDFKNGKGEKKISHLLLYYIRLNNPNIYKYVLQNIIEVGYWKDVLHMCDLVKNENIDTEVELFSQQLLLDYSSLSDEITMCAKWAPSENSKYHLVAKLIIEKMNVSPREYRKILTHLRSIIAKKHVILEQNLSQHNYNVDIGNIPFKSRELYKNSLKRFTNSKGKKIVDRIELQKKYNSFIKSLSNTKINKIIDIAHIRNSDECVYKKWNEIITKYMKNFKNCACVIDVSNSMKQKIKHSTLPIDVSISFGIFIQDSDYKNKLFSFSDNPVQINLNSSDILSKINTVKKTNWNNLLNYDKLKSITEIYQFDKLFILTDINLNNEERIKLQNFNINRIVYWNLRSFKNEIKLETTQNLTEINGFTNYLMDSILSDNDLSDLSIFNKIISKYNIKFIQTD